MNKEINELMAEDIKELEEWKAKEKTVTLTNEEWNRLRVFLLMSTNFREGEADAWARAAAERKEDGSVKYEKAAGNAKFWRDLNMELEKIQEKIDEA